MRTFEQAIQVYQELAELFDRHDEPRRRDQFFLLAAETAWKAGQTKQAEQIRRRLLQFNPSHLIKPYRNFQEARESFDVQSCLEELEEKYPLGTARQLLDEMWEIPASDEPEPVDRTEEIVPLGELPAQSPDLPQTAPLLEVPREVQGKPFKVYPEEEQPQPPQPNRQPPSAQPPIAPARQRQNPPLSTPRPRPQPAQPPKTPDIPPTMGLEQPREIPQPQHRRPRRSSAPSLPVESPAPEASGSGVLARFLCLLMSLGALMWVAYVLCEPFLGDLLKQYLPFAN